MSIGSVRKLLGVGLVPVLALLALPASAQNAPRIGFIIEMRVQKYAKAFSEGQSKVAQFREQASQELGMEQEFKYLTGVDAARAVELSKKSLDRTITPQETQELIALRQRNNDLDLEFLRLFQNSTPTAADTARLRQLQEVSDKRNEEIQAKRVDIENRLRDELAGVQKQATDLLIGAIKQVKEQYQLEIVLNTYIPSYPAVATAEGQHEHDYAFESVVFYGGLDVTDRVITIMNGGEAPPPPGPDEPDMRVPGSQVAQ